jgi:hypothetical protein
MRIVVITLIILSTAANSFSQYPFGYDKIKYSFGFVMRDRREEPIDDTLYTKHLFICDAIYKTNFNYDEWIIHKYINVPSDLTIFYFGTLPQRYIDSCLYDGVGDTLMLIDSVGAIKVTISEINFMQEGDFAATVCQLKLLHQNRIIPKIGNFIALRKQSYYTGQIYTYQEINLPDYVSRSAIDSLRSHHIMTRLDIIKR